MASKYRLIWRISYRWLMARCENQRRKQWPAESCLWRGGEMKAGGINISMAWHGSIAYYQLKNGIALRNNISAACISLLAAWRRKWRLAGSAPAPGMALSESWRNNSLAGV
jgi:hypothetical protein